jgi:F420H2 dehydrogenase subunit O
MADCELCTLAKPTLYPIKVQVHTLANPEGAYRGVCESCLSYLNKAWEERFGEKKEPEKK